MMGNRSTGLQHLVGDVVLGTCAGSVFLVFSFLFHRNGRKKIKNKTKLGVHRCGNADVVYVVYTVPFVPGNNHTIM